jgi:hypothetical protein
MSDFSAGQGMLTGMGRRKRRQKRNTPASS